METDYRQLCCELFGTADVEELKQIANRIHKKNIRNAGRKPKLSAAEIIEIQKMLQNGTSIENIADTFNVTRQSISRYVNGKPQPGYTMRMTLMYRANPCTDIDVNFLDKKIKIRNRTDDLLHRAFGAVENPDWEDFEYFLQERCFPASRGNAEELLHEMGLSAYEPLSIVEKTRGRMADDRLWLKFKYYSRSDGVKNAGN